MITFQEIEATRKSLNVSQYELCKVAELHPSTYTRLVSGDNIARGRTLRKLHAALDKFKFGEVA
ncbi:helix-turn-helix domain-containing protein [Phyllobacterium sp. LjRoot231]|uniref:helix-turn-helix domain-containing protein n=1 Tax=Phyllobacterium sp. LjRoot231 TaxID=3342289 RepID=UPI003F4FD416